MPITEFLEKNAQLYKDDISLVEINPELQEKSRVTWREYSLIEQGANGNGRCEIKSITREFRQGTMAKENY